MRRATRRLRTRYFFQSPWSGGGCAPLARRSSPFRGTSGRRYAMTESCPARAATGSRPGVQRRWHRALRASPRAGVDPTAAVAAARYFTRRRLGRFQSAAPRGYAACRRSGSTRRLSEEVLQPPGIASEADRAPFLSRSDTAAKAQFKRRDDALGRLK